MQLKTLRPVEFELTQGTRDTLPTYIKQAALKPEDFLFPSAQDEGDADLPTNQDCVPCSCWAIASWSRQSDTSASRLMTPGDR